MESFTPDEQETHDRSYREGYLIGRWVRAEIEKDEMLDINLQIARGLLSRQDLIIELRESADYDNLTGLMRREPFETLIKEHFVENMRKSDTNKVHSLLFMDLDNFKTVNDMHGHVEGDTCLKHAAQAILNNLNRSDDYACRWGGEEFVAILGDTTPEGAEIIARMIRDEVNKKIPGEHTGQPLGRLGITIGIATFSHGTDFVPALEAADNMMVWAKKHAPGKNEIIFAGRAVRATDQI